MVRANALKGGMPKWKFIANIALTKLENFVLRMDLTEYHSGFRAYGKKALELPIELNSDNFVFDTEIIVQLKLAGMRIREIPISTRYFPEASMIGFWRSVKYGFSILGVMAKYLLHKIRAWKFPAFNFALSREHACRLCGRAKAQLAMKGNLSLREFIKEEYLITDEGAGRHDAIYRCVHCSLSFVPSENGVTAGMIGDMYGRAALDAVYVGDAAGRRKTAQRILAGIARQGGPATGRILDFGCSAGLFLAEAKKRGYETHGIELSRASVAYARETLGLSGAECGDEKALARFPDGHFQAITAFDVLEHVDRPGETLNMMKEKLQSGGMIVATFPDIRSLTARLLGRYWHALVPSHLSYFSPVAVRQLAEQAGLEIIGQRHYKRYLSLAYLLRRLLRVKKFSLPKFLDVTIPINTLDECEVYMRKR